MKSRDVDIPLEQVCLLDPKASLALTPSDGDAGKFTWFLFGGILGDDPPRDRTAELRALGFPTRHLGPVQMTTDTALGVTKRVIVDRVPLDEIPYIVRITSTRCTRSLWIADTALFTCPIIRWVVSLGLPNDPVQRARKRRDALSCVFASNSSTRTSDMPYSYAGYMITPGTKNEPLLPPGMKEHLHADLDQSFDF